MLYQERLCKHELHSGNEKKIKTVKDAMDEANVYLKYRRNNNDDNEETEINMVDNDNVDMDELDEFLSQFE